MKHVLLITALCFAAGHAQAACFAHYKAKQDDPLQLHYGVMQIEDGACTPGAAMDVVNARLLPNGWTLLNIVKTSPDTPTPQEQSNAGEYFLRF